MQTKTRTKTKRAAKKPAIDKYQLLNDQLIKLLEQDLPPWKKDWRSQDFGNLFGEAYKGVNPIICLIDSMAKGYESPLFVSFKQAQEHNWFVKKDSKATHIVFAKKITKRTGAVLGSQSVAGVPPVIGTGGVSPMSDPFKKESKDDSEDKSFYMSSWKAVFNLDCIDDSKADKKIVDYLGEKHAPNSPKGLALRASDRPVVDLDNFIKTRGVEIDFKGSSAYYSSSSDRITMPVFEDFCSVAGFYSTALHELAHSTGHKSRLNRPLGNAFGSPEYAFEELIAEIASCMVCQDLNIEYQLENHASYLKSWITRLKEDKTAFVRAFGKAQAACNYLTNNH